MLSFGEAVIVDMRSLFDGAQERVQGTIVDRQGSEFVVRLERRFRGVDTVVVAEANIRRAKDTSTR